MTNATFDALDIASLGIVVAFLAFAAFGHRIEFMRGKNDPTRLKLEFCFLALLWSFALVARHVSFVAALVSEETRLRVMIYGGVLQSVWSIWATTRSKRAKSN